MNRVTLLVAICAATVGVSYGMYTPLVPVFAREELGADYSQVGIIGMSNYLPYMLAPLFVGVMLDRVNKSYILASGVLLAALSVAMLSIAGSVPEVMFYRLLAGIAHALFWPASEVLISANSTAESRVKRISVFIGAWVLGFMMGPLAGRLIIDLYDFRVLFQLSSLVLAAGIVPTLMLRRYGLPSADQVEQQIHAGSMIQVGKEMVKHPSVSAVLIYYAITFGVILAVYPAYMREASVSNEDIEYLFFAFGISRFATLCFVPKISKHGTLALIVGVSATAAGMLLTYSSVSILSFAVTLVLVGFATSIFYPVTFGMVTKNTPPGKMGQRLGAYEAMFGMGWTAGPLLAGFSSDSFGSSSPYLAFFVIGCALAASLAFVRKR